MPDLYINTALMRRDCRVVPVRHGEQMELVLIGLDADPNEPPRAQPLRVVNLDIYLYLAGAGTIDDQNGRQRFEAGSVVLRFPDVEQRIEHDANPRFGKAYCAIPASLAAGLVTLGVVAPERTCWRCADPEHAARVFARLSNDCRERHLQGAELWSRILDWIHVLNQRPCEDEDPLERAAELLADDHLGLRDIAALAAELGIGYSTFRRRFATQFGTSPSTWRMRARMQQACSLLIVHPVGEVAELLGYANAFAFSAQFRRVMGVSPRHWLERQGQ